MVYQIIPPMLVILSLIGIVIFFMKKSSQIASLDEEEIEAQEQINMLAEAGFFHKAIFRIKNIKGNDVKHLFLLILEKVISLFRIVFLKLEDKAKKLGDFIRKNKNSASRQSGTSMENIAEDDIINKVKNYQPEEETVKTSKTKKTSLLEKVKKNKSKEEANLEDAEEEKVLRPTVSDRVVTPKSRTEMKDRLEDLLIERIAANPKDTEAYERLGEYYMEIDSLNDAKECFKQVLKLDRKNHNVMYRMKKLEDLMHKK